MTPVASLMTNPMTTMTTIEITINPAAIIPGIYCFIVILMFVYKYKDAYNYQVTYPPIHIACTEFVLVLVVRTSTVCRPRYWLQKVFLWPL